MTSTTITPEGRQIRLRAVGTALALLLVVAVVAIAGLFDRTTVVPGPAGSSHVTTEVGTAAWFETLQRLGGEPARLERPVTAEEMDGVDAYVVLDPGFSEYGDVEARTLRRFVEEGGTVVIGGLPPSGLVSELVEERPEWSAATISTAQVVTDRVAGVPTGTELVAGRFGAFDGTGSARPLAEGTEGTLALWEPVGSGRVVLVADVAVFGNGNLGRAGNAELAVGLVGTGRVLFDEYRHGFTEGGVGGGIVSGLPGRGNAVVSLLAVVAAITLVVYGRRLGPPEPEVRELAPERRIFLESVARNLRRTGDPLAATDPVRAEVRRRVAARAGLAIDADEEEFRQAALAAGLEPEEVDAVLRPASDTVLVADRALARVTRTRRDEVRQ